MKAVLFDLYNEVMVLHKTVNLDAYVKGAVMSPHRACCQSVSVPPPASTEPSTLLSTPAPLIIPILWSES